MGNSGQIEETKQNIFEPPGTNAVDSHNKKWVFGSNANQNSNMPTSALLQQSFLQAPNFQHILGEKGYTLPPSTNAEDLMEFHFGFSKYKNIVEKQKQEIVTPPAAWHNNPFKTAQSTPIENPFQKAI